MLIHVHRHDEDSLLDGCGTAATYADRAADLGQWALAQTNHATLSGTLKHIRACEEAGIVPICGVEAYFRNDRTVREDVVALNSYWHLVLLAKDLRGWHNLMRATSRAYSEGFYGRPALDWEVLEDCHEGLIATSSCISGYVSDCIVRGEDPGSYIEKMLNLFGDDFYLAVQPHNFDDQRLSNVEVAALAGQYGVPLVAEQDAHYPMEEWSDTHEVVWLISTASTRQQKAEEREKKAAQGIEDTYFSQDQDPSLWLTSEEEMRTQFERWHPDLPELMVDEAIASTEAIACKVTPFLIDDTPKIPQPAGGSSVAEKVVRGWIREGMRRIGKDKDPVYVERKDFELQIWESKGVFGYFYVVGEVVRWAKENGIRVGIGRGSAAGSLCLYCMKVTGVDPIAHGLMFERFMNPARSDFPDVDVDFQHDRIEEVRQHLRDVWGEENVAQIVSHQRFQPRAAVRAVSIALDVPWDVHQRITRDHMEDGSGELGISQMATNDDALRGFLDDYPEVERHALRLEGSIARLARHPAGVVVMDRPVFEYVPVMRRAEEPLMAAWSAQAELEERGLGISAVGALKFDFLSTDGLSIQARALDMIEEHYGERPDIDALPVFADPKAAEPEVIALFGMKRCFAVFQFGGQHVQRLLADIRPTDFMDLVATNAIDRPGPLTAGIADDYALIKNGQQEMAFWHDSVKPFLEETYGLMIYQEQVMQVVQAIGGFTLAEADLVRKAMTKWQSTKVKTNKGRIELAKYFERFEKYAVEELGLSKETVRVVWDGTIPFTIYGFNKSHADGYACQAYQDMWLKKHYPDAFHAAVMAFETDRIGKAVAEAQGFGVEVRPPDVNSASERPEILQGTIIFPLSAVKGVGEPCVKTVVKLRDQDGPYFDFEGFEERVLAAKLASKCNSRQRENLLKAGAFDMVGGRDGWSDAEKRKAEVELMGFALQGGAKISEFVTERVHSLQEIAEGDGGSFIVGGTVVRAYEHLKSGKPPMGFVTLQHGIEEYEVVCFADAWPNAKATLREGEVVLVAGPANQDRNGVVCEHVASAAFVMASGK